MAEPSTTTPVKATTPEPDRPLATKLHVPRPRPGFLARPRLLDRLNDGTAGALTLVCAPAGFGKTRLLGDWARRSRQPVAWLSLDGRDSDPARFWRYVAAALDELRPGVGQRVDAVLQGVQPPPEAVVTVVINELVEEPREIVLILDDYHLVEASSVHDSLAVLLERLPPHLRLVVAGRADPPLPLARLRASGQLFELREADLRFTSEESAELLQAAVGAELPPAAVTALGDRTEGWAAGLQLAALSLRGQDDIGAFVAEFSGSHRFVLDYLTEEVLDRQPEPLRSFLLETSILERLSGPLGDAVTGRADSQELLEQAERANLFLHPLDEVRGWWRYHHLFADLLGVRLQQERPERVPDLHRAAAAWHEAHGLADDAIAHALAAGDATWAARLIERQIDARILRWEGVTLQRWFTGLPAELVRSRPRLSLAQARLALIGGQLEAIEGPLEAAERGAAEAADEPYEPSVGRAASMLANLPAAIALERAGLARVQRQGRVGEDLLVAAGQATVASGSLIGGDLIFATGRMQMDGAVTGSVLGTTGNYTEGGSIGGTERVNLQQPEGQQEPTLADRILDGLRRYVSILVVGLLLLWLLPRLLRGAPEVTRGRPLVALGVGLLAFIGVVVTLILISLVTALVAVVLALLGLGSLSGLTAFAGILVAAIIAFVFVLTVGFAAQATIGYAVGRLLLRGEDRSFLAGLGALALGVLLVALVTAIPFVGRVLEALVVPLGLGGLVLMVRRPTRRQVADPVGSASPTTL
jgi:hypothetical protein